MVTRARLEAERLLMDVFDRYDLTWGEIVGFHAHELSTAAKYMVREERHPDDPDKKGDEA